MGCRFTVRYLLGFVKGSISHGYTLVILGWGVAASLVWVCY